MSKDYKINRSGHPKFLDLFSHVKSTSFRDNKETFCKFNQNGKKSNLSIYLL